MEVSKAQSTIAGFLADHLVQKNMNFLSRNTVEELDEIEILRRKEESEAAQNPNKSARLAIHGFRGNVDWALPTQVYHCAVEARPDYAKTLAHEYNDAQDVLDEKVALLASLLLESKATLVYTGAGLSTASGIGDYATKGKSAVEGCPRLASPFDARPTFSHHALRALHGRRLIHHWVQQNHDGLPQKAGLPQEAINEIHGAWYDPSNPVVPMSGSLREDLFADVIEWEDKADLTLAVGTSLSGMNCDRLFCTVAKKALKTPSAAIGGVIVGLQKTQFDAISCLRIYAKIDVVMQKLLDHLSIPEPVDRIFIPTVPCEEEDVFLVPYDSSGNLTVTDDGDCGSSSGQQQQPQRSEAQRTILDLREGSKVRLTQGPYAGDEGIVNGKQREGHYKICFMHKMKKEATTRVPMVRVLGTWWVQAAVMGAVDKLPLVNIT